MNLQKTFLWGLLTIGLTSTALAEEPTDLREALTGGKVSVSLRYRFETVDQVPFDKDANASTLRTTLGYRTVPFKGFSLFLEAENVTAVFSDDSYSNAGAGSLNNRVRNRPVVADPEITEVNQAYLRFEKGETTLTAGRQTIALGDQRFVGPVGWRQNHQSIDALRVDTKVSGKVALSYAFLENVNRIFGDDKPMASHLLQATSELPVGKLTLYGFRLDYERSADTGLSTLTYGAEYKGSHAVGGVKLLWEAELAQQDDTADNRNHIDAGYLHGMAGVVSGPVTVQLGLEVLEGSPGDGRFSTPLATLHKFNGWADKFLGTPTNGLEDLYLSVSGKTHGVGWKAVYHDFSAESSNADYGTELDLQVTHKTSWQQTFGLKAAFYNSDGFATDTDKVWLFTSYGF